MFVADLLENINSFVGQEPQYILDHEAARIKLLNELRILQNALQKPDEAIRNVALSVRFYYQFKLYGLTPISSQFIVRVSGLPSTCRSSL